MHDERYQKIRDYALKLLSLRPRSNKEMRKKLLKFTVKRGIPKELIEKLINDLISQNLLNDKDFVKWWIEQRCAFRPKGRKIIRKELMQKGIGRDIIESVLTRDVISYDDEFDLACKAASKKISLLKKLSKKEAEYKLGSFLARRGFEWEVIYKVIDSLIKKS